ncbi:MAG: hypothetical protein U0I48_03535 [Acutalibacteraceae bacterium]|nr:hypothetical protein [Acutalibacteraceae bacterium]
MMNKNFKQESKFSYKGFPCVVVFMPGGYRCGYVGIPKTSKYFGKSEEKIPFECHGGITYAGKCLPGREIEETYWIGFDCAHCFDGRDEKLAREIYSNDKDMMRYIEAMKSIGEFNYPVGVKSLQYVENECRKIVDQITEEE